MTRTVLLVFVLGFSTSALAQEFSYGFKTGLNYNTFVSDSETDDAGNELEKFTNNSGFHVGATFAWKATELMGVRDELLFSQKGGNRDFDGTSYYTFTTTTGNKIFTTGTRKMTLNVTNSYLSIPVMGYFKPAKWVEIYAGGSLSFLIASSAFGELTYEGKTSTGVAISKFTHEIDANYYGDKAGEVDFASSPPTVQIGSEKIPLPQSAGAYFEFTEDRGKLYKTIETSVLGGISFYLNRGLYLSARANYSLNDVTKTKADISLVKLDSDKNFITRDDNDRNLSLQFSIGFSL